MAALCTGQGAVCGKQTHGLCSEENVSLVKTGERGAQGTELRNVNKTQVNGMS